MVDSHFQIQLTAVLDVLVKTAVTDICALADNWFQSLQLEITRSKKENEDLRQRLCSMELQSPPDTKSDTSTKTEQRDLHSEVGSTEDLQANVQICNSTSEEGCRKMTGNTRPESPASTRGLWRKDPVPAGVKAESVERSISKKIDGNSRATSDVVYAPVCPDADITCPLYDFNPGLKTESGCSSAHSAYCEDESEDCAVLDGDCETESPQHYFQPKREEEEEEEEEEQFDISCLLTPDIQLHSTHLGRENQSESETTDCRMALNVDKDLQFPGPNSKYLDFLERTSVSQAYENRDGGKYICNVCGKNLATKNSLTSHYRLHTGEKPFTCTQCGKSFAKKFNLDIHYNVHTGAKPYACMLCLKSFADPSAFRRHKRTHRRKSQNPFHTKCKFICSVCEKGFSSKPALAVHFKLHTAEK